MQFLGLFAGYAIKFGAPGLRLRERPFCRRRQGLPGTRIGRAVSRGRHRPRRIRFGHTYARCELFPERQGNKRIDEVGYMNSFSCYLRAWGKKSVPAGPATTLGGHSRLEHDDYPR
jgi:hypothetical protein